MCCVNVTCNSIHSNTRGPGQLLHTAKTQTVTPGMCDKYVHSSVVHRKTDQEDSTGENTDKETYSEVASMNYTCWQ